MVNGEVEAHSLSHVQTPGWWLGRSSATPARLPCAPRPSPSRGTPCSSRLVCDGGALWPSLSSLYLSPCRCLSQGELWILAVAEVPIETHKSISIYSQSISLLGRRFPAQEDRRRARFAGQVREAKRGPHKHRIDLPIAAQSNVDVKSRSTATKSSCYLEAQRTQRVGRGTRCSAMTAGRPDEADADAAELDRAATAAAVSVSSRVSGGERRWRTQWNERHEALPACTERSRCLRAKSIHISSIHRPLTGHGQPHSHREEPNVQPPPLIPNLLPSMGTTTTTQRKEGEENKGARMQVQAADADMVTGELRAHGHRPGEATDGAGQRSVMHWSRAVNVPMWAAAAPLQPTCGPTFVYSDCSSSWGASIDAPTGEGAKQLVPASEESSSPARSLSGLCCYQPPPFEQLRSMMSATAVAVAVLLFLAAAAAAGVAAAPRRILVDTDMDTDDLFALLYILKHNRSEFDVKVGAVSRSFSLPPCLVVIRQLAS
ncbi:hypothetical protein HU200_008162 [Digitaria exilis]|uniref:Inosine/uridine-preferring nucleoside hydrolase domain-containing protein n=1 Tax=Digitaria exilis TaxID=1010633 RepID=A0A835FMS6_9POAL|nr:hypothetical protein HU200_008162 [Digitaria exilis]